MRIIVPIRPSRSLCLAAALIIGTWPIAQAQPAPKPTEDQMERLVGEPMSASFRQIRWQCGPPAATNLYIYVVQPPLFDEGLFRKFGMHFGIRGELEPLPLNMIEAPGYMICERAGTNQQSANKVGFSLKTGQWFYSGGLQNIRRDPVTKRPAPLEVPSKEIAKELALKFMPVMGFGTNQLEHYANGRIRWAQRASTTGFTDRETRQAKYVIHAQGVTFYQAVPMGGTTYSIGNGGNVEITFGEEGKIIDVEALFRPMTKAGEAKARTQAQVERDLKSNKGWSRYTRWSDTITVTSCTLAYPQGNALLYQTHVWPFYMLSAVGEDGKAREVFIPLEW